MSLFARHKSGRLCEIFKKKTYQGQDPAIASVVFFGRDANYPENIEESGRLFEDVITYHEDGVGYWQNKYNNNPTMLHHPFLIHMRHGDPGYKYHKTFSDVGLGSAYASHVSFVELLDVPTMGELDHSGKKYGISVGDKDSGKGGSKDDYPRHIYSYKNIDVYKYTHFSGRDASVRGATTKHEVVDRQVRVD